MEVLEAPRRTAGILPPFADDPLQECPAGGGVEAPEVPEPYSRNPSPFRWWVAAGVSGWWRLQGRRKLLSHTAGILPPLGWFHQIQGQRNLVARLDDEAEPDDRAPFSQWFHEQENVGVLVDFSHCRFQDVLAEVLHRRILRLQIQEFPQPGQFEIAAAKFLVLDHQFIDAECIEAVELAYMLELVACELTIQQSQVRQEFRGEIQLYFALPFDVFFVIDPAG
ncbi:hypothetical protein D9M70_510010 [compost metagenome]